MNDRNLILNTMNDRNRIFDERMKKSNLLSEKLLNMYALTQNNTWWGERKIEEVMGYKAIDHSGKVTPIKKEVIVFKTSFFSLYDT